MSENETKNTSSGDNKNILIIAGVVAAVVILGGFIYTQQNKSQTASIELGGNKISATFSQ